MVTPFQNDVVTIVRDPKHTLGKRFAANGAKSANVMLSFGIARQVHVPDAAAMVKVLKEVADDPHAALINSSFIGIGLDEEFIILSESQLRRQLGFSDREQMLGVHNIKYRGKTVKAVGRFKENVKPSTWQLLDRDVDEHTPQEFAALDHVNWLRKIEQVLPGLESATKITVPSASARVSCAGKPVGKGNSHTWVQLVDANDVERARSAMLVRAMDVGLTWEKPRRSRTDPSVIVGRGLTAILDTSVWVPGRLVFDGKPSVAGSFKVAPLRPVVKHGSRLDTSLLKTPAARSVNAAAERAGFQLRARLDGQQRLVIDAADLTFDTELELESGKVTTVREALKELTNGHKVRCQTPFRDSSSCAAFLSRGRNGKPFLHDSGTNTTHWLNDDDAKQSGLPSFSQEAPTVEELIAHLRAMTDAEAREEFAAPTAKMALDKQVEVFEYITARLGMTKSVFNAAIKEAHREEKHQASRRSVGDREIIPYTVDAFTEMALKVETVIAERTPIERYHIFAGKPAQLVEKELPDTHQIGDNSLAAPQLFVLEPLDDVGMLAAVEREVVFQDSGGGGAKSIAVPNKVIDILLKTTEHSAPVVTGLLMHPVVLPDGTVVAEAGYHAPSKLYIGGPSLENVRPYRRGEARLALQRIKARLLEDFQFRSKLDEDMAVAALFTGLVRRVLDQAPGFVFVAPIQSSGKTTLARMIHVVLTDRDMPVSSFAEGDEAETQKRLLATLRRAPVMVCLDNITDGTTFTSPTLAAVLTSSTYSQRVLGVSEEAECLTNVLFIATGNNLSLGPDEASRWLPVHLDPKTARPQERKFKHADVVTHARSIRADVLRDCIGIVAGFMKYGKPMPTATRFARWERMVRQPLCWAAASDPLTAFRSNADKVDSSGAAAALLVNLKIDYAGVRFSSSEIAARFIGNHFALGNQVLAEALSSMRARDVTNSNSVGRALGSIVDRPIDTSSGTLVLRACKVDGLSRYWVETL